MRHRERRRVGDFAVGDKRCIDVDRRNLLSAAIDHLLDPADEAQVAILVENAHVPRSVPVAEKRFLVRRRIALVSVKDIGAANDYLALLALFHRMTEVVDERYLAVGGGTTDRPELATLRRQRVTANPSRFRRRIGFDDRHAEDPLQAGDDVRVERAGRRSDETQGVTGNRGCVAFERLMDANIEVVAGDVPGWPKRGQVIDERPQIEWTSLVRMGDAAARKEGGTGIGNTAAQEQPVLIEATIVLRQLVQERRRFAIATPNGDGAGGPAWTRE